jgi:outer membrane receptor protein involved in Fe transport
VKTAGATLLLAVIAAALSGGMPAWGEDLVPYASSHAYEAMVPHVAANTRNGSDDGAALGAMEGTVVDAYTRQPLFATDVVIDGTGLGGITDKEGRFAIGDVPEGSYRVTVSMMGYAPVAIDGVRVNGGYCLRMRVELVPRVLDIGLDVIVEASRFHKDSDNPTSFRTLSPQEMRYSPGALEDVFRVLQSMPGVSPANMTNSNLVVRGGDPSENRTVFENIEIPRALHFGRPGGMIGGISIVSPSLLERVDFHTGGFPARYGDRLSSVFEMQLRDGSSTDHSSSVNLNLGGFSVATEGPLPGGGTMIFSARRGVFDVLTTELGVPALPSYWDVVGKVTYDLGNSDRLSLVGFYFPDDLTLAADPESEERHGNWSELDLKRSDHGRAVGLNWRHLLGGRGYLLTTASQVSNSWTTSRGTADDSDLVGDAIREEELQLKSEMNYEFSDRVSMRFGIFGEQINSEHNTWSIADTLDTGSVIPAYRVEYKPDPTYKAGSHLQTTIKPFSRVALTAGIRYDYYDFTRESNVSPRLGLVLSLTDRTTLNAAYGHYYQTAAPWQVALNPANASLRSSRAVHYVAGIEHLISDNTQVSLEAYHKDLMDAFVHDNTTRVTTNEGSGHADGVELCIQKKMSRGFVGSLAYTYSVSKRRKGDTLPEYYSEYDRPHNLTLVGSFAPSDRWRIGAKFLYATGSPYTPIVGSEEVNGEWYGIRGETHSARYPDYHMLDIRIDRTFRFGGWELLAYLDLWNVYGRRNVTVYDYSVGDDGTVTRTAADEALGMLPILGLEAHF